MLESAGCLYELCELFRIDWPHRNKSQSPFKRRPKSEIRKPNRDDESGRFISHHEGAEVYCDSRLKVIKTRESAPYRSPERRRVVE